MQNLFNRIIESDNRKFQIIIHVLNALGILISIGVMIYAWRTGILKDIDKFQDFMNRFGKSAALIFILFQIMQVIIPIIPGGITCLGGVILFGPWMGFVYNYVSICIGSIIVFFIGRKYGTPLIIAIFGEKAYNKYIKILTKKNRFDNVFAALIFFPIAPDDMLCYIAGTTKIKFKKYFWIIILGKPMSIALYSLGLEVLFKKLILRI